MRTPRARVWVASVVKLERSASMAMARAWTAASLQRRTKAGVHPTRRTTGAGLTRTVGISERFTARLSLERDGERHSFSTKGRTLSRQGGLCRENARQLE